MVNFEKCMSLLKKIANDHPIPHIAPAPHVTPHTTSDISHKEWTKDEWQEYKDQHPGTQLHPKIKEEKEKEEMEVPEKEDEEKKKKVDKIHSHLKQNPHKMKNLLENPKMIETTNSIKENIKKNPGLWPKLKEKMKSWIDEDPNRAEEIKSLGSTAFTTALLVGAATHFPLLIPSAAVYGASLVGRATGMALPSPKKASKENSYTMYLDGTIKDLADVDDELQLIDSDPEYAATINYVVDEWGDEIQFAKTAKSGAIIKKTRTHVEEYEVCPHCDQEIGEKETFIDKDNNIFHSPCYDKGPIDKLNPIDPAKIMNFWQTNNGKLNFAKIKSFQNS